MRDVDTPEMSLRDYWRVLMRRKGIVFVGVLATVIPAVVLSLMQAPTYRATADIIVRTSQATTVFGTGGNQSLGDPKRKVANEISVLEGTVVFERVKADLGLTTDPPPVNGTSSADTDVVAVSVESGDAQTAAVLTNAYIAAYNEVKLEQSVTELAKAVKELQSQITKLQDQIDEIDDQIAASVDDDDTALEAQRRELVAQQAVFQRTLDQRQVDASLTSNPAEIVRPAEVPEAPFEPTPLRTAVLALVVGLLLGIGAAFLVDYVDQSIKRPDDLGRVGTDLPLLAVVPLVPTPDTRPVALSVPNDLAVESYRALRTSLQFAAIERDAQVIQVTSAMPGEGKTTTAANLAVVLAQTGVSVVLVDADLRKPRVHQVFGLDQLVGLTDVLVGTAIEVATQTVEGGLEVITSGRVPPNPSEMLSSRRMADFITDAKKRFDYVVIDSPPTLPVSDSMALSRHVDGVLLVVQAGKASAPQVRRAIDTLQQVDAPLLGMVLNQVRASKRKGGYGYGYGYGYGGKVYGAETADEKR